MNTRRILLMCLCSIFLSTYLFSQSPIWTLGNQQMNWNLPNFQPLPFGPDASIDYNGQKAELAANAWHHPIDGSLMFFIVDGVVYDKDGYRIRDLMDVDNAMFVGGVSEVSIIPDPANCFRFYFILDGLSANFMYFTGAFDSEPRPYYAVLNLELQRTTYNTNRYGEFEMFPDDQYVRPLMSLVPPSSNYFNLASEGTAHIAVSPKTQNDEHFIFYHSSIDIIYTFKLNGTGLTFVQNSVINAKDGNVPPFNYSSPIKSKVKRSELEVVPLANGQWRLVGRTNEYGNQASEKIFKVDYTANGVPLPSTYLTHLIGLPITTGYHAIPKGIEISPNKQYIYFTHTTSPSAPKAIVCLDINTMIPVALPAITNAQAEPFKYSIIETSSLGVMMANASGIYTLLDADDPANASIDLFLPLIGINQLNLSRMSRTTPDADYDYGLYLLPDQHDFDPSFSEPEELTCECCFVFSKPTVFEPWIGHHNYVVSTSQTWTPGIGNNPFNSVNGVVEFNGNLIISPGVVLTIEGMTLKFGQSSRVIVERDIFPVVDGASLITENTTFTALDECNQCLWPGIEVQGHHDLPHTSSKHARVEFKSGTIIEHAYFGVIAGRIQVPDQVGQGLSLNAAGGVIETKFATFKNNRTDVHFIPYSFIATESLLSDTKFITDDALRLPESQLANLNHVVIHENMGIGFNKCTFDNETAIQTDGIPRGVGIKSYNSHYVVGGCFFRHLDYGIRAENANSALPFQVGSSHFIKNFNGIFAHNVMSLSVTGSQFNIYNSSPNSGVPITTGIALTGCNRYRVEENSFYDISQTHPTAQTYGVVVSNSGPYPNVIEQNTFGFLHSAGISRNINAEDYTAPSSNLRGLKWLCNNFYDNKVHDLWVSSGRIAPWQANINPLANLQTAGSAGNTFNTAQNPDFHVSLNTNVPPIRYFYSSNANEEPTLITTSNVFKVNVNPNFNDCGEGRPGGDGLLTEEDLMDLRLELIEEKQTAKLLFDYSDKDSTINQVLSEYLTTQQKRDLLMTGATIISDEVLIKYIESNPPHTMLYQVLVHNSPLSDKVIYYMMEESNLTSGMKQQILSIQAGLPENETLLNYIQNIELNIQYIEAKLANSFIADSLNLKTPNDVVTLLMDNPYFSDTDLELLFYASVDAKNQYLADSLNTILKSINQDWEFEVLNDLAVATIGSYYYDVIHDDSLLIAQLEEIADFSDYMYAYPARAILSGVLGYKFEYPEDEEFGNRSALLPRYTYDGALIDPITIFPNPASDHFFIVFDENADVSQSREARVYDLAGNLQFTRSFDDNAYVLEINTEHMTQGMYIVVISENGTDVGTYKVVVR